MHLNFFLRIDNYKRFTALLLALVILLPLMCGCGKKNKIDAVIILPGIMGSELYLSEDSVYNGKSYPADTKLWLTLDTVEQIFEVSAHIEMLDAVNEFDIRTESPIETTITKDKATVP